MAQRKKDAQRQRILDAALHCFSRDGFHQAGMADIVARSGMSQGAVYVYFKSKDDIIEALAVDRHRQEALLGSLAESAPDAISALNALVDIYADYLTDPKGRDRRRVGVHGWAEALRNKRVRERVVRGIDAPRALVVSLLERAKAEGQVARDLDCDAVARCLIALFQGLILQSCWGQALDTQASTAAIKRMLAGLATRERPSRCRTKRL